MRADPARQAIVGFMTGAPRKKALQLWRRVHDSMKGASGWRHVTEEWVLSAPLGNSGAIIRARLAARSWRPPAVFWAFVEVNVPKSGTARAVISAIKQELTRRGYKHPSGHLAGSPVFARRTLKPSELAAERAFLAQLLAVADAVPRATPKDLQSFVAFFRGARARAWRPASASWERRRPITVAGRATEGIVMVHLYPGGRRGGPGTALATSVAIWPPWNGTGAYPTWLTAQRAALARQFRAVGHKAEWVRGPKERGVGIMSIVDHPASTRVASLRRALGRAALGDAPPGR